MSNDDFLELLNKFEDAVDNLAMETGPDRDYREAARKRKEELKLELLKSWNDK